MKFRFCGGLEPPDWLLAEVPLLSGEQSKVTPDDLTAMCETIGADIGVQELDRAQTLFQDAADAKAAAAALRFILTHAAMYDADRADLVEELQQLGMQQAAADAIAQSYGDQRVHIQGQQRSRRFQFPHVEQVEWEVKEAPSTTVKLKLKLDQPVMDCGMVAASTPDAIGRELSFDVDTNKFLALYEELSQVQSLLRS
ncbi:hypothetical protein PR003_g886 [Phytophthora rubi]|uniref:COMM domain-containing protein n=1 Tax=Phytophthora rubi TaxID=129364 RepID=A0A6A4FX02_9STRA|nr:hypothetical protein PR002_g777 [Phytophthora rubi]KAE9052317.1 hypothetical protein PR001_g639 [Phytophthora rubi]KAE9359235.1 hypothetical protein PR003_g886 [Phytophthora rubi]